MTGGRIFKNLIMKKEDVIKVLRTAKKTTAWGLAIHTHLDNGGDINELLSQLRSQYKDSPKVMLSVFNSRLSDILV